MNYMWPGATLQVITYQTGTAYGHHVRSRTGHIFITNNIHIVLQMWRATGQRLRSLVALSFLIAAHQELRCVSAHTLRSRAVLKTFLTSVLYSSLAS